MIEMNWSQRWSKDQIKAMLIEQSGAFWAASTGIERSQLAAVERASRSAHAVIVSGLRRVGKSTLLAQMAHKLGRESFYYLNFEDDRFLGFRAQDASYLHQILVETFGERQIFFVDEVQNLPSWEHFVRRFMDLGVKFYITGSNASLLGRELGTRLTGRYVPIELFPFSFLEFLVFQDHPVPDSRKLTTVARGMLNTMMLSYLRSGGVADALKYPELAILRTLYEDVLYRDIATRHQIGAVTALKELAFFLMSNPSGLVSFNKLKNQLRLGSINTIKSYIGYMENSWLVFPVNVFDASLKRQQIAPKKVYCIDTGLNRAVGFSSSPDTGKLLENMVFLALRRKTRLIYYVVTPQGYEVDFFLPETGQLIQVTQSLGNPLTREREIRALQDAIASLKVSSALILADAGENGFTVHGVPVVIRSLAEWLLEQ
jgi:uncharacterized protein